MFLVQVHDGLLGSSFFHHTTFILSSFHHHGILLHSPTKGTRPWLPSIHGTRQVRERGASQVWVERRRVVSCRGNLLGSRLFETSGGC